MTEQNDTTKEVSQLLDGCSSSLGTVANLFKDIQTTVMATDLVTSDPDGLKQIVTYAVDLSNAQQRSKQGSVQDRMADVAQAMVLISAAKQFVKPVGEALGGEVGTTVNSRLNGITATESELKQALKIIKAFDPGLIDVPMTGNQPAPSGEVTAEITRRPLPNEGVTITEPVPFDPDETAKITPDPIAVTAEVNPATKIFPDPIENAAAQVHLNGVLAALRTVEDAADPGDSNLILSRSLVTDFLIPSVDLALKDLVDSVRESEIVVARTSLRDRTTLLSLALMTIVAAGGASDVLVDAYHGPWQSFVDMIKGLRI